MNASRVALVLVLLLAALLRLPSLGADPPVQALRRLPGERASGAFLSDEGWYNRNALRHALGREPAFEPGGLNTGRITPAYHLVQSWVFGRAPVTLATARLSAALAGLFTLVLLVVLLGEGRAAVAAVAVVACDFVLVAYGRLALPDSLGILLVVAAGAAACRRWPRLAGVLAVLAYAAKPTYLLPALLGVGAAVPRDQRRPLLEGIVAGGLVLGWLVLGPHLDEVRTMAVRLAPKRALRLHQPLAYLIEGVWWRHWGPLFPLAALGLWARARSPRGWSEARLRWSAGALAGALLAVAPFAYQPLRYHLAGVIPAACLAALCLESTRLPRRLAVVGLLALLAFDGRRFLAAPTRFTLRDAARRAAEAAGPDAVVLGHLADTFALEARWRAAIPPIEHEADAGPRIRAAAPTHVLTIRGEEGERWCRRFLDGCAPMEPGSAWHVLGDYYTQEPVRLRRLGCLGAATGHGAAGR